MTLQIETNTSSQQKQKNKQTTSALIKALVKTVGSTKTRGVFRALSNI